MALYLAPALGHHILSRLTPAHVLTSYAGMRDRGLSGTSVHLAHGILRGALKDAVRWGLVGRNVTDASHHAEALNGGGDSALRGSGTRSAGGCRG